jgi:hypothetical protein
MKMAWLAGFGTVALLAAHGAATLPHCPGDFNGDGEVAVNELVRAVNYALDGCPVRFVDNGNGTVTDNWTGLMWEKKSDDDGIHDQDNVYTWSSETDAEGIEPTGTAFTEFLATLNSEPFAGHADWRMPTRPELETILDLERSAPTTDAAFDVDCLPGCAVTTCSCSYFLDPVWSFTTYYDTPVCAWIVSFDDGAVDPDYKNTPYPVRAVRAAR